MVGYTETAVFGMGEIGCRGNGHCLYIVLQEKLMGGRLFVGRSSVKRLLVGDEIRSVGEWLGATLALTSGVCTDPVIRPSTRGEADFSNNVEESTIRTNSLIRGCGSPRAGGRWVKAKFKGRRGKQPFRLTAFVKNIVTGFR